MRFLLSLTRSVFACTGLESLYIAIIGSILIALLALLWGYRHFFFAVFACCVGCLSVLLSDHNYQQNNISDPYYVGEATVTQRVKPGRYVITTSSNGDYFFHTDTPLPLGQQLFVSSSTSSPTVSGSLYQRPRRSEVVNVITSGNQFNYDKRQRMKGIAGTMYSPSFVPTTTSDDRLSHIRQQLGDSVQELRSGDTAALILGMLIGDKSFFDPVTYQAYIDSSLVHLVAVSGGNIVLLLLFLRILFFWIPFYPRIILLSIGVVVYATICGADSSVMRATIMGLLSLCALFAGRIVSIWRLLAYAWCLMLLYNPLYLVYDVGFLLSFSAIVGIVLVSGMGEEQTQTSKSGNRSGKFFGYVCMIYKQYVAPTLGASLGVLPVILFFMGSNNLIGVLVNIAAGFLVPIVMLGSIVVLFLNLTLNLNLAYASWCIGWTAEAIKELAFLASQHGVYLQTGSYFFVSLMLVSMISVLIVLVSKKPDYVASGHGSSG